VRESSSSRLRRSLVGDTEEDVDDIQEEREHFTVAVAMRRECTLILEEKA